MNSRLVGGALPAALVALAPLGGSAQDALSEADRGGFTMLLSLGVGYQNDRSVDDSKVALAGLNVGLGGWLTDDLVLWFRASGTNADYGSAWQTSGVGAAALQYWVNERVNVEGGLGFGFWSIDGFEDRGLGVMLGAGYSFFTRGRHSLQIGVEYAPAFTDPEAVHNVGITFGWQLL